MNLRNKALNLMVHIFLLIYSIIILYPMFWMLMSSFKSNNEFMLSPWNLPAVWRVENYISAWEKGIQGYFLNSIFVAGLSTLVVIMISSMFSFMLARFPFKGSEKMSYIFFIGNMIPIHCVLIPLFSMANKVGLIDSLLALVIVYIAFNLPMSVFLTYGIYRQLPNELQEASVIDGCNVYKMYWHVFLPLGKPAIITSVILTLVSTWNEFSFALILINDARKLTIPLGLMALQGTYVTDYSTLGASLVIAACPLIIIYMLLGSRIQEGMTAGAVKG